MIVSMTIMIIIMAEKALVSTDLGEGKHSVTVDRS